MFKYTLISLLSELDGLLWNNTSPGSIYTFNSTSDYDSKKHPFGAAGTVEVKRFGGSSTIQILYDINNHVFLRRKVGEEAFQHVLRNASGAIKRKVNEIFGNNLREMGKEL